MTNTLLNYFQKTPTKKRKGIQSTSNSNTPTETRTEESKKSKSKFHSPARSSSASTLKKKTDYTNWTPKKSSPRRTCSYSSRIQSPPPPFCPSPNTKDVMNEDNGNVVTTISTPPSSQEELSDHHEDDTASDVDVDVVPTTTNKENHKDHNHNQNMVEGYISTVSKEEKKNPKRVGFITERTKKRTHRKRGRDVTVIQNVEEEEDRICIDMEEKGILHINDHHKNTTPQEEEEEEEEISLRKRKRSKTCSKKKTIMMEDTSSSSIPTSIPKDITSTSFLPLLSQPSLDDFDIPSMNTVHDTNHKTHIHSTTLSQEKEGLKKDSSPESSSTHNQTTTSSPPSSSSTTTNTSQSKSKESNMNPTQETTTTTTTNDTHNSQTTSTSNLKLGLLRVKEKTEPSLEELCTHLLHLSDKSSTTTASSEEEIYELFPEAILGRNHTPPKKQQHNQSKKHGNKVNIGIPNTVNGVSRNQVKILQIQTPSTSTSTSSNTIIPKSSSVGRILESSIAHYMDVFQQLQSICPIVQIQCLQNVVNPIIVIRSRINRYYAGTDVSPRRTRSRRQTNSRDEKEDLPLLRNERKVRRGESLNLKVGDLILFDPYRRGEGEKVERGSSGGGGGGDEEEDSHLMYSHYVYRVVAFREQFIVENENQVENVLVKDKEEKEKEKEKEERLGDDAVGVNDETIPMEVGNNDSRMEFQEKEMDTSNKEDEESPLLEKEDLIPLEKGEEEEEEEEKDGNVRQVVRAESSREKPIMMDEEEEEEERMSEHKDSTNEEITMHDLTVTTSEFPPNTPPFNCNQNDDEDDPKDTAPKTPETIDTTTSSQDSSNTSNASQSEDNNDENEEEEEGSPIDLNFSQDSIDSQFDFLGDALKSLTSSPNNNNNNSSSYTKRTKNSKPLKIMNASFANTIWRAMSSAEPHNGFGFLLQMAMVYNVVPNPQFARSLFECVMYGPKSDGIYIRDANKTELVTTYLEYLLDRYYQDDMMEVSLKSKSKTSIFSSIGPSNWDEMEQILSLPILQTESYIVLPSWDGNTNHFSPQLIRRLKNELQLSSRSLSFMSKSLSKELEPLITKSLSQPHTTSTSTTISSLMKDNQKPFCTVAAQNTIRETLKCCIRLAVKSWIRHGHWLSGFINEDGRICKSDDERCCVSDTRECLRYLGLIVCYMAWLYCDEEGIPFAHDDCCFIIQETVLLELEKVNYDHLNVKTSKTPDAVKKKFVKSLKLDFVLSLDCHFARPLQTQLGKMLKITKDLSILLG